jgi:chromate reductase, NAD(P)H dehydrogenase (quinone)
MQFLAISGSLRAQSANSALLARAIEIAPPSLEVELWSGLAGIAAFNPDLDETPPPEVRAFRSAVSGAEGVLICSPEYAHGVAGALKNALDWLVGSGELYAKPVALINVSPRATVAHAALIEILRTMGADPLIDVVIPVDRTMDLEAEELLRPVLDRMRDAAHLVQRLTTHSG